MDDFSALFADDENTAQRRQMALANALRGRQALATIISAGQNNLITDTGKQDLEGIGQEQQLLAQSAQHGTQQRLTRALQAQKLAADRAEQEAAARMRGEEKKDDRGFTLYRDTIQNAAAERRARIMAQQQDIQANAAATRGTVVPGYEVTPESAPTAKDAETVKKSLASAAKIKKYSNELRQLHKDHGTEYGGDIATAMDQLAVKIDLEAKNIGELGALSGPDAAMVEAIRGAAPSSLKANLKSVVSGGKWDNTQSALDGLDKWATDALGSTLDTYGYRPKAGGAPAPTPTAAPVMKEIGGKQYILKANGKWAVRE